MLSTLRHYCISNSIDITFDTDRLSLLLRGIRQTQTPNCRPTNAVKLLHLTHIISSATAMFHQRLTPEGHVQSSILWVTQAQWDVPVPGNAKPSAIEIWCHFKAKLPPCQVQIIQTFVTSSWYKGTAPKTADYSPWNAYEQLSAQCHCSGIWPLVQLLSFWG